MVEEFSLRKESKKNVPYYIHYIEIGSKRDNICKIGKSFMHWAGAKSMRIVYLKLLIRAWTEKNHNIVVMGI